MRMLRERIQQLGASQSGAGATEYIVLLILIACVIIAVVTKFGGAVQGQFTSAEQQVMKDVVSDGSGGPPSFTNTEQNTGSGLGSNCGPNGCT